MELFKQGCFEVEKKDVLLIGRCKNEDNLSNENMEMIIDVRKQVAIKPYVEGEELTGNVIITPNDKHRGSPKRGDIFIRNPYDQNQEEWLLVSEDNWKSAYQATRGLIFGMGEMT